MAEPVPFYRGLASYLERLVDLSKKDKQLNAAIKDLAKNLPVANGNNSLANYYLKNLITWYFLWKKIIVNQLIFCPYFNNLCYQLILCF